jgi:hypothetical protein
LREKAISSPYPEIVVLHYWFSILCSGCLSECLEAAFANESQKMTFLFLVTWYMVASGNLVGNTACIGDTIILYTLFNKPLRPPCQPY